MDNRQWQSHPSAERRAQTSVDPDFVPIVEGKPALLTRDADWQSRRRWVLLPTVSALVRRWKDLLFLPRCQPAICTPCLLQ